jgi:hypothetical protein
MTGMRLKFDVLFLLGAAQFCAADAAFLRTRVANIQQGPPVYAGDPDEKQLKSVARYGKTDPRPRRPKRDCELPGRGTATACCATRAREGIRCALRF